jgi:hypothetical protein
MCPLNKKVIYITGFILEHADADAELEGIPSFAVRSVDGVDLHSVAVAP